MNHPMPVSRRQFAAIGSVAALGPLAATAFADESATSVGPVPQAIDVVIVGAGLAGLVAGIQAQELGASAIIVDKCDEGSFGGDSLLSGGGFLIPPTDDEAGVRAYIDAALAISKNRAEESLTRVVAQNAWDTYRWLEAQGCEFLDLRESEAGLVSAVAGPVLYQGMPVLLDTLKTKFVDNGGTLLFNTKARELVCDENTGAICGVDVKNADGIVRIAADAVILATGGYIANEYLLEAWATSEASSMILRGRPYMTGDGLLMAMEVGATCTQVGGPDSIRMVPVHPQNPIHANPGAATSYLLAINKEGKRFIDESLGYQPHGHALCQQPLATDGLVFDSQTASVEAVATVIEQFESFGIELLQADTLEELAEQMDMPVSTFVATIEEYNDHVNDDGTATGMLVNKAALASKVQTAPFYGIYPIKPGVTVTLGGLKIGDDACVLEADGTPIDGLYAAGEVTGGFFVDNILHSACLMRTAVFGRVAAQTALAKR